MLIHLMENYIRLEKKRMEDDNTLNLMISEVEVRNRETMKDKLVGLHKEIEEELEHPMIPYTNDSRSRSYHLEEDQNHLSGVGWLNRLGR